MHWTANIPDQRFTGGLEIDADLACVRCGYNLRGLPADGKCPECGTPARETLEQSEDRSHLVNPLREHAGSWFAAMTLALFTTLTFASCLGALLAIILVPTMAMRFFTTHRVARIGFTSVDLGSLGAQRFWLTLTRVGTWIGIVSAVAIAAIRLSSSQADVRLAVLTLMPWWLVTMGEGFLIGLVAARSRGTLGYRWIEILGFITVFTVPVAALLHALVIMHAATNRPGAWVAVLFLCWPLGTALPAMTLAYLANALNWLTEPVGDVLKPKKPSRRRTRTTGESDRENTPIPLEDT